MRLAETVTFGGSGLDRAAELRGDPGALVALKGAEGSATIVHWRGKPLVRAEADGSVSLVRLPFDHPALEQAVPEAIFLGREGGAGIWATDLSPWVPEEGVPEGLDRFADPSQQHHPALTEGEVFAELRAVMTALSPRDAELTVTARAVLSWHRSHRFCAACGAPSEVTQAGWQRNCPACNTSHFPRTDPVVIMLITHGNDVLLGRSPGWPEGMYSLLAGFVEPGETMEAAVRREVFEEAGIRVGEVSYLSSQPWPFPMSLMLGCAGRALDREITLDPAELEDARWVSRERLAHIYAGGADDILPGRPGAIARFLLDHWLADRLD